MVKVLKIIIPKALRYHLNSLKSFYRLKSYGMEFGKSLTKSNVLIGLKEISPLHKRDGYFYISPTLSLNGDSIELHFRETNVSVKPVANRFGQMLRIQNGEYLENALFKANLTPTKSLVNQEVVISSSDPRSMEDVRVCKSNYGDILIGTSIVQQVNPNQKQLSTKVSVKWGDKFQTLCSPVGKRFEKNWIPIRIQDNNLELLHSNFPFRIIKLDLNSGVQSSITIEGVGSTLPLSGGTPFVLLEDGGYIRVARMRFAFFRRGFIHFNFLVLHDENLKEIQISKPFVFKKLGFEICNGLVLTKDKKFVFSWAEDDTKMYLAECDSDLLLRWLEENQLKIPQGTLRYRLRINYLRKIFSKR